MALWINFWTNYRKTYIFVKVKRLNTGIMNTTNIDANIYREVEFATQNVKEIFVK